MDSFEQYCFSFSCLEITHKWDELIGQQTNTDKSRFWGTSHDARKVAATAFPGIPVDHCVNILGAKIQTTEKKIIGWEQSSTDKILRELRLINALPACTTVKEHLVSMKILPQINYAANINFVPKEVMKSIQSNLVQIIWKNRPIWRSRDLLLAGFSRPHRTEPFLSKAYES